MWRRLTGFEQTPRLSFAAKSGCPVARRAPRNRRSGWSAREPIIRCSSGDREVEIVLTDRAKQAPAINLSARDYKPTGIVPGGDAYVRVTELPTDVTELDPGCEELRSELVA